MKAGTVANDPETDPEAGTIRSDPGQIRDRPQAGTIRNDQRQAGSCI